MGKLTRTTTLTTGCTRQDLYDLINKATVTNLSSGDVAGTDTLGSVTAASLAPPITAGLWWYDQTTQLLKAAITHVGASPASLYLAVGPDAWHYPGYNVSALPIRKGEVVRWSYAQGAGDYDCTPMEPCVTTSAHGGRLYRCHEQLRNVYGIAQATILPNTFGPILCEGIGQVIMDWLSFRQRFGSFLNQRSFEVLCSSGATGTAYTPPPATTNPASAWPQGFGMGLAGVGSSNPGWDTVLCPVLVKFPMGAGKSRIR